MSNRVNIDNTQFWLTLKNKLANTLYTEITKKFRYSLDGMSDSDKNAFNNGIESAKNSIQTQIEFQVDEILKTIKNLLKDNLVIDSDGGLKQTTDPPHFKIRKLPNQ